MLLCQYFAKDFALAYLDGEMTEVLMSAKDGSFIGRGKITRDKSGKTKITSGWCIAARTLGLSVGDLVAMIIEPTPTTVNITVSIVEDASNTM